MAMLNPGSREKDTDRMHDHIGIVHGRFKDVLPGILRVREAIREDVQHFLRFGDRKDGYSIARVVECYPDIH